MDELERLRELELFVVTEHRPNGPYCAVCPGDTAEEQPDCTHWPRFCRCCAFRWPCESIRIACGRNA